MSTVDMSADAVTARLREASRLRRTTIDLMRLGVASNIMNGVIEFVPATSTDDAAQFENEGTHVLCVDLGFAKARRSCGFVADDEDGSELTFADCVGAVVKKLRDWGDECPVALVIEAPLSMRFESGNPVERSFEARDGKHRGWYCNAGGGLYLGAQVFLRRLRQERFLCDRKVMLFEGFVTFKPPAATQVKPHVYDAKLLRDCLRGRSGVTRQEYVPDGESILEGLFNIPGAPLVIEPTA